jgi:hypothetical protein
MNIGLHLRLKMNIGLKLRFKFLYLSSQLSDLLSGHREL